MKIHLGNGWAALSGKEYSMLLNPCTYQAVDSKGHTLYVGASKHGLSRLLEVTHFRRDIFLSATSINIQFFKTKEEAFSAERKAIESFKPRHNDDVSQERLSVGQEVRCPHCEDRFVIRRHWQRFCSDGCRNAHWTETHQK